MDMIEKILRTYENELKNNDLERIIISLSTHRDLRSIPLLTNFLLKNCGIEDIGSYFKKSIPDGAFYNCENLKSIIIPNSVTSIGDKAFYLCRNLVSIKIGNRVTSIGEEAFYECKSLSRIIIPNSVTSIGEMAFSGCTRLANITIPNSVTSIGDEAFYKCTSLTSIVYNGTQREWHNVKKGAKWNRPSSISLIKCKDGDVPVV